MIPYGMNPAVAIDHADYDAWTTNIFNLQARVRQYEAEAMMATSPESMARWLTNLMILIVRAKAGEQ